MDGQISNPFAVIEERLIAIESNLARLLARPNGENEKKYYTISEAAKILKVAEITLYRGIKAGKIPSKSIGTRIMIPGSFVGQ